MAYTHPATTSSKNDLNLVLCTHGHFIAPPQGIIAEQCNLPHRAARHCTLMATRMDLKLSGRLFF